MEPLAAVTAPSRVSAKHQSLLHFVGQAPWSDAALLARVRGSGVAVSLSRRRLSENAMAPSRTLYW
ncbi:hypothetical protein [Mesorhizobium sp. M1169]|uniref:hypothetical protein n=1 Tax=Mesorhizobium sp. M1169 TaxID=2957066 RepID=UPI003334C5C9